MLFFKGFLIGIGKILPGVSGSVIAVILNEYSNIIVKISDIKKNYKYLFIIFSGILTGIIVFSNIMVYLLKYYYLNTMLFFIGLMVGGISKIYKNNKISLLYFIIGLVLLIIPSVFINTISINASLFTSKFIFGIVESISTIIPGISGSAIFMMLEVYDLILFKISNLFNLYLLKETINFFIPYLLGIIISSIVLIKVLNIIISKYKVFFNSLILSFSFYSIIYLLMNTFKESYSLLNVFLSILLFLVGYFITKTIKY